MLAKQLAVNSISLGQGDPVLLIHGLAASLFDWTDLMPDLADAGYQSYALDLLGHGESNKPNNPDDYSMECVYDHLSGWIEQLQLSRPAFLVGHSLGGYLSLLYALRRPQLVRGLVLINPFYSHSQLSPVLRLVNRRPAWGEKAMRATPEWLIHTLLGWDPAEAAHFSPEVRRQIANDYKRASPHVIYIVQHIAELGSELSRLACPVRVIWGDRDLTLNPDSFRLLVAALPDAAGYVAHGCGHQPHIGKPHQVGQEIIRFFKTYQEQQHHEIGTLDLTR